MISVYIGRNIDIFLIYNVIYYNLLLKMFTVGKVFMKVDFQENEVMSLLHGALQWLELIVSKNCLVAESGKIVPYEIVERL